MNHKYNIGEKFYIKREDNKIHKCKIISLFDLEYHNLYDDKFYLSYKIQTYGDIATYDEDGIKIEYPKISIAPECMLFKHKLDAEYNWVNK